MLPVAFTKRWASPILNRWGFDPFAELERFASGLDGTNGQFAVRLDVREDEGHYYVEADLPGFRKEDLEISFQDGVLTLSGERKQEEKREGENYHYIERRTGRFARSVRLPDGVKDETLDATLKDGVLTVKVAKAEEAKPRRIKIKSN